MNLEATARLLRRLTALALPLVLISGAVGLGLTGCAPPAPVSDEEPEEEDIEGEDSGVTDAGKVDTGGGGFDLGLNTDAGPAKDAGTKPDAGTIKDAGTVKDGGAADTSDAGAFDDGASAEVAGDGGADGEGGDVAQISCKAAEKVCVGKILHTCNATGDGYTSQAQDCAPGICQDGACKTDKLCVADALFCEGSFAWQCNKDGTEKTSVAQCGKTQICKLVDFDGDTIPSCVDQICVPKQKTCSGKYDDKSHSFDGDVLVDCSSDGTVKKPDITGIDCAKDGKVCALDAAGVASCAAPVCGDGKVSTGEQCDLGMDAATGESNNGAAGASCTKDCKAIDESCETDKDCEKLVLGPCDLSHVCNAKAKVCVAVPKVAGPCDDGNACTKKDTCVVGDCLGIEDPCNDGNPCTKDSCAPKSGCKHEALFDKACDDGETCTVGDKCSAGQCQSGLNACECKSDSECLQYEDGDPCTGKLKCLLGACEIDPSTVVTCGKGVCIDLSIKSEASCQAVGKKWVGGANGKCHDPLGAAKDQTEEACTKKGGTWTPNSACGTATCIKASGACEMKILFNGAVCDDADACSKADQCFGGFCTGEPVVCDDGNQCTADTCDPKSGCVHVALNEKPCDDGDACTNIGKLDTCANGKCGGVAQCECKVDADCAAKNPDNKCLGTFKCNAIINKCVIDLASVPYCDPKQSKACAPFACDPASGQCKTSYGAKDAACDDGDACTKDDKCGSGKTEGECVGMKNKCEDGNPCTTDVCDPNAGCVNYFNNNPCNDNNPCTKDDKCVDGQCYGDNQCECTNEADCTKYNGFNKCLGTYKCNTQVYQCHFDPATVVKCGAGLCSDPNQHDKASCVKASGTWTPDSDCALTTCNALIGKCEQKFAPQGKSCSDGDNCTQEDACDAAHSCKGATKSCDDNNGCSKDSCDPNKFGGCVHDFKSMDGQACEDGDVCNDGGKCKDGTCEPGTEKKNCEDGNSCTSDGCDPKLGCYNLALAGAPCDDGNWCTGKGSGPGVVLELNTKWDGCDKAGSCKAGDPLKCNDGAACTQEACDPKGWINVNLPGATTQSCAFVYLGKETTCTSGDKCTENDFCINGTCSGVGTDVNCDDGNVCTNDSCEPNQGCTYKGNDAPCDDADACTVDEKCVANLANPSKSACFTQQQKDCDDENLCTQDSCDPKTGCKHAVDPAASSCGDFAKCSSGDNPVCEFVGNKHLMISEIYVGDPDDPSDDFIEVYNPTQSKPKLGDYELQWRPADSAEIGDWKTLAKLPAVTLHDYGYLLVGNKGPVPGGFTPDAVDAVNFVLKAEGMQVRIFDVPHTLTHDVVTWGTGDKLVSPEGKAVAPWFSARSLERKASKDSDADSLLMGGVERYAGNGHDTGDNSVDFALRWAPEPQGLFLGAVYEPACQYKCPSNQICDFKGSGADKCVLDAKCALGCGSGKICEGGFGQCVPDFANKVVISAVFAGEEGAAASEFIQIWNGGKQPVDITGWLVRAKGKDAGPSDVWKAVAQVPARTVLEPGRFWLVGTQTWASRHGGVDAVVADAGLGLEPDGGAVSLFDPRVQLELDKTAWGVSKEYTTGAYKKAGFATGSSLVRKAHKDATASSMGPDGKDEFAGHAIDTDVPNNDFVMVQGAAALSMHSGAWAPACGGGCPGAAVCNYVAGGDKCVDPTCGGQCKAGSVCNVKTGQCDLSVLISQYSVFGPEAKGKVGLTEVNLAKSGNEWIELYNPGQMPADIEGMLIQAVFKGDLGWKTKTNPAFSDKCIEDGTTKTECNGPLGPQGCGHCTNDVERDPSTGQVKFDDKGFALPKQCVFSQQCTTTIIPPGGRLLIAAKIYDVKLPRPDWVSQLDWGFDPNGGGLRLVRSTGEKFPPNKLDADKVGWGDPGSAIWCKDLPQVDQTKPECTFMRKPWPGATAAQMADPLHPAYYGGNGLKTDGLSGADCQKDWALVCPRKPRNSRSPAQKP